MSKGFASNYRIVLLAAGILVCFSGLGARLVFLHVVDRDQYLSNIDRARRQIIVEKARRGDIFDTRNQILATSTSLVVLGVDPQALRPEDEKKWPRLAELIGLPLADLRRILLTKARPAAATVATSAPSSAKPAGLVITLPRFDGEAPAPENKTASAATAASAGDASADKTDDTEVDDTPNEKGERLIRWAKLSESLPESAYKDIMALGIKGVYGNRHFSRTYPNNSLAAHVIGYVNREGEPVTGIERYADFYLHGRDGWREGERDGKGREVAQFRTREVEASDGYSVTLSLDKNVQHMVEEELDWLANKFSPIKATIIVSDPRTGFILGMGNYPTFNLNEYNKVPKDEQASMKNAAVADVYEPGSVFKIVAASGALEENLVTSGSVFDCTLDKVDYKGRTLKLPAEDHRFDHPLTVAEIISHSSNKGAAQLGMLLGEERLYRYARAFGFGRALGFPVGGEVAGIFAAPEKWYPIDITRIPMGHTVAATALQMHQAMSAIANNGVLLRPQIIREIRDASSERVYSYGRAEIGRAVSVGTARTMARLLMGVATKEGTCPEAAIEGFEVAGKTGTTQKLMPVTLASGATKMAYSSRHHVASFVGFFPASRPEIAISVIVDDADGRCPGGVAYGHLVAGPSFHRLGEKLIQYYDIKPVLATPSRNLLVMEGGRR